MEELKILIIDDEKANRKVTFNYFDFFEPEKFKFQLLEADSAARAIEILNNDNPNDPDIALLILDIVMEDNEAGFRVIDYLKSVNNHLTQVIINTGMAGTKAPSEDKIAAQYNIFNIIVKGSPQSSINHFLVQVSLAIGNFMEKRDFKNLAENRELELINIIGGFNALFNNHREADKFYTNEYMTSYITNLAKEKGKNVQDVEQKVFELLLQYQYRGIDYIFRLINKAIDKCQKGTLLYTEIQSCIKEVEREKTFRSGLIWKESHRQLASLYLQLTGFNTEAKSLIGYIPFNLFESHFKGFHCTPKIDWLLKEKELLQLIFQLCYSLEKNFLAEEAQRSIHHIFVKHFILENGIDIEKLPDEERIKKIKSLKSQLSQNTSEINGIKRWNDYNLLVKNIVNSLNGDTSLNSMFERNPDIYNQYREECDIVARIV